MDQAREMKATFNELYNRNMPTGSDYKQLEKLPSSDDGDESSDENSVDLEGTEVGSDSEEDEEALDQTLSTENGDDLNASSDEESKRNKYEDTAAEDSFIENDGEDDPSSDKEWVYTP